MPDNNSTPSGIFDVLEAAAHLAEVADPFVVYRHGLRYELAGASVAVYDASMPWPEGEYTMAVAQHAQNTLIARMDIPEATEAAFHAAIDRFELRRYVEAA